MFFEQIEKPNHRYDSKDKRQKSVYQVNFHLILVAEILPKQKYFRIYE